MAVSALVPLGESPSEKNSRQLVNLEHVAIGKVEQLCRNMLLMSHLIGSFCKLI
jgi:hypothetical protein